MWRRTLLLFAVFTPILGENSKVFDVTTVFEAGRNDVRARVHSRTNALGLPFFNEAVIIAKNVSSPNLTCDFFANNVCSWKVDGWTSISLALSSKYFHTFNNGLALKLNSGRITSDNYLFFTSYNSEYHAQSSEFHFVYLNRKSDWSVEAIFYESCSTSSNSRPHQIYVPTFSRYNGYTYTYCSSYHALGEISNETLRFYFDSYIRGYRGSSPWGRWRNNVKVNYVYIANDGILSVTEEGYSSETANSEIISPKFYLASRQILYLVVLFKSPTTSTEPVFDILAEDSTNQRFILQTINYAKVGWNIVHLNLTIPQVPSGLINLVIKKTTSLKITISWISDYDPDEEVNFLQTPTGVMKTAERFHSSLATVTAPLIEPANKEISSTANTTRCLNGGVLTEAGCACPPGFSKSKCQQGCGRNRFGQDCGGLCSLRKSECEGLMMCTNPTGCHCAPGYKGENCTTKCSDGWYGNDCLQHCGHCSSSSCDIYTGECHACEPGYLPPLCQFESVYYSSKPLLTSPDYGIIKVSFNPKIYVATSGTPEIYQIQYKEKSNDWLDWKTYINRNIEKKSDGSVKEALISENIEGLKSGITYQVRILLIDENFYKYDGDLVQPAEIITKCDIPEVFDYKVKVESSADSLFFSWTYDNTTQYWCPVEEYEVTWKENWQLFTNQTYTNFINLKNLLPGAKISFKVRAKTSTGFSPYSDVLSVSTTRNVPSIVRNLKVESIQPTSAEVSWEPPTGHEDQQLQYSISYKCVDQPACSPACQNVSEGQMTIKDTHISLKPLVPFTRYKVTVAPQNGPTSFIYIGTAKDVSTEVPIPSNRSPLRTNTSVTVFWDQPVVCSSFLLGYNYQLVKESESLKILDNGFTKDTSMSFHNLTASTQYIARVYVVTIGGWSPESYLAINVSTSATVPDPVRNLTVYKRGKGMLGLRWAPPQATYGQLKSFTVTYTLGQDVTSHTVEPTPCVVWPELFCYTIEALRPNRRYNLTVSARNSEVAEDGQVTFVTGITKETTPTAPEHLKLINSSSSSILLQWSYPELANGIVRTFVISVEETDNYDQDNCCQIYPLVETQVKEEAQTYETEVSGLHPASTYFVGVSAKTVGMGPPQSLVVQTRPPHLPLDPLPRVEVPSLEELTWLPQQTLPTVSNPEIYTSLVKAHLLLAVVNESQPIQVASGSGITDPRLKTLLHKHIEKPFFFVAEYNQDDVVTVVGPLESTESIWGHPPPNLPPLQKYQMVAVQVSDYNGTINVDLRFSQPFTLAY